MEQKIMNTEKSTVENLRYIATSDRDSYDLGTIKLSSGSIECCEVMRTVLSQRTMSLDVCLEVSEEIEDLGKTYTVKHWASTKIDDPKGVVVLKEVGKKDIPLKPSCFDSLLRQLAEEPWTFQRNVCCSIPYVMDNLLLRASRVTNSRCEMYLTLQRTFGLPTHLPEQRHIDYILNWIGCVNVDVRLVHIHVENAKNINWWLEHSKKDLVNLNHVTESTEKACDQNTK